MSNQNTPGGLPQITLAHVGMAAVICATIIGVLLAIPDSQNPYTVLVLVLGFFGQGLTLMSARQRLRDNGERIQSADEKLDRVLNGEMQAKIEAGVHKVLSEREPLLATPVDGDTPKRQERQERQS